jgi:tyrosine-specific transport protein
MIFQKQSIMSKNYFKAIAILAGTVLGAGIFTVPFVIQKAGILSILIYFPLLHGVQLTLHLIYAEIVLATKEKHRMVGYVGIYFNGFYKKIAFLISLLGKNGTLVAYIILGGMFLHQLLGPFWGGNLVFYTTLLFIIETTIVLLGLKMIAKAEVFLTVLLVIAIGALSWRSFGHLNVGNYELLNFENLLMPYGAIFFAIGGQAAIPEICQLLQNEKRKIRSAIIWGTFLPVALIAFFAFLMIGVTGANTTPDVLAGLANQLDSWIMVLALLFGLLAVVTSYIVISQSLKEIYWWDEGINKYLAWFLATTIPFGIYLIGVNDLIAVIGLTGAITGGLYGIILISIYLKVQDKKRRRLVYKKYLNKKLAWGLSLAFILGVVLEIIGFWK